MPGRPILWMTTQIMWNWWECGSSRALIVHLQTLFPKIINHFESATSTQIRRNFSQEIIGQLGLASRNEFSNLKSILIKMTQLGSLNWRQAVHSHGVDSWASALYLLFDRSDSVKLKLICRRCDVGRYSLAMTVHINTDTELTILSYNCHG